MLRIIITIWRGLILKKDKIFQKPWIFKEFISIHNFFFHINTPLLHAIDGDIFYLQDFKSYELLISIDDVEFIFVK